MTTVVADGAYDLAIVGGGIGGAVLAALAVRRGQRVIVLERSPVGKKRNHPEILWPSSIRILRELIPGAYGESWSTALQGISASEDQHHLLNLGNDFFAQGGVEPLSTDPEKSRSLLLQAARTEVRYGWEAKELVRDERAVRGVVIREVSSGKTQTIAAKLVVADDGSESTIRSILQIGADLQEFPVQVSTFQFSWPVNTPRQVRVILNSTRTRSGLVGFAGFPRPLHDAVALLLWDTGRVCEPERAMQDFINRAPSICELVGMETFPPNLQRRTIRWGHARQYGIPGAILLGDAAHPVSPAGGQGANMAIADASLLAQLLETSPWEDILPRYDVLRRTANERSLAITRRAAKALRFMGRPWSAFLLPQLFRQINAHPQILRRGLQAASRAFQTERLCRESKDAAK